MERVHRHLRPLVVAVATLALSASVVLAGGGLTMPEAASDGLARAAEAAGKTVPVVARPEAPAVPEQPEQEPADQPEPAEEAEQEPAEEAEQEPAEEAAEHCAILPEGEEYETHGAKVCAAAQAEVPEGFANRGAYVREVAQDNHGAEVRAQKAANGGVPDAAKAAKEKAKEKARSGSAGAGAGANATGGGGRP